MGGGSWFPSYGRAVLTPLLTLSSRSPCQNLVRSEFSHVISSISFHRVASVLPEKSTDLLLVDAFSLENRKKIFAATLPSTRGCAFLYRNRRAFSVLSTFFLPQKSSLTVLLVSLSTSPVHMIARQCRSNHCGERGLCEAAAPSEN